MNNLEHLDVGRSLEYVMENSYGTKKYVVCIVNEDTTVELHYGPKLAISDTAYIMRVLGCELDSMIYSSNEPVDAN